MKTLQQKIYEARIGMHWPADNAGGHSYDIHNTDGTISTGYKPGKHVPSTHIGGHEIKAEPKHPLQGKKVVAKHSGGQEVHGRLIGTEHQGTVAKIKHKETGHIHFVDAKSVQKA